MYSKIISFFVLFFLTLSLQAQRYTLSGAVVQGHTPLNGATVTLNDDQAAVFTRADGKFVFKALKAGTYTLVTSFTGFRNDTVNVVLDADKALSISLQQIDHRLDSVKVYSSSNNFSSTGLRDVEGTAIYAGKKTEVVLMKNLVGNKATNNSRQIYAKVAGLNIWENDAAGLQLAIGGRGLSPNRVANFNTRQNGYDISADALGYPESYYTPPAEVVDRIEIVRGAASLQYGTQFGGMINFRMQRGSDSEKIALNTRLTGGSFGFVNSSTIVSGTTGNFNYLSFYQHKSGNGWRPNSEFYSNTVYADANLLLRKNLSLDFQYTHMDYLAHQPGGLTDADFAADPHQSVRERNWFKVNWNLGALVLDYQLSTKLRLNNRLFGLAAERDALGILTFIDRADDGTADRNLYVDHYRNWGNETRLLYQYNAGKATSTALFGVRWYQGHTDREQGYGNNGHTGNANDFRFTPALASDSLRYSDYRFPEHNLALFAENIFRITNRLSIVPGLRFEQISTRANGHYNNAIFDLAGTPVFVQKIDDQKLNERSFLIAGLGATWLLRPDVQAYANFSQNYKAINFNDLRTQNPNLKVDSLLKDEKGFSADVGLRKHTGFFTYDVSLFLINYNNKIGSIFSVDTVSNVIYNYRTNVSQSLHTGLESYAEADLWKLWKGASSGRTVSVFANFSVIRARYIHSKDASINGHEVEFVPSVIFKTGMVYRYKKIALSYQYSYTSHQYTDATNAVFTANAIDGLIPAYAVMDLSAEYRFNKHIGLSANVNNLTNRAYFTRRADSYPGPGIVPAEARAVFVTVQIKL